MVVVFAGVFYYGGNAPGSQGWSISNSPATASGSTVTSGTMPTDDVERNTDVSDTPTHMESTSPIGESVQAPQPMDTTDQTSGSKESKKHTETMESVAAPTSKPGEPTQELNPETGKDKYLTDPVPEGKPLPIEPQDVKVGTMEYTCKLSISCATIMKNVDLCDPEKLELVPENGWILEPTVVTFYEGESVFNVLQRTCKQLGIHMEYMNTPIYNSAYIEGIHNLYEFDVGELSGWMYRVNDWFPNYGCSRYQLKDGDVINWVYTCDLGYDVGGGYAVG